MSARHPAAPRRSARRLALACACACVAGCASSPPPVPPTDPVDPFGVPHPAARRAAAGGPGASAGAAAADGERQQGPGTLDRAALDEFLAQGPHWFIRQVGLEPAHLGDRFVGFRITRFFEADPRFAEVDLRLGDVVLRVNDLPIGKPDQFMRAWEDVKACNRLTVEYVRGGSVRFLAWEVLDGGAVRPQIVTGGG